MPTSTQWTLHTLAAAVDAFRGEHGISTHPSRRQFYAHNRGDLWRAVQHHGGPEVIAAILGIPVPSAGQPSRLQEKLADWIDQHGCPGMMPVRIHLAKSKHNDIIDALDKYGWITTATKMGLRQPFPLSITMIYLLYWPYFHKELKFYERYHAIKDPTPAAFSQAGRPDLALLVDLYGLDTVRRRLSLV